MVLRDGRQVNVRAIRTDDEEGLLGLLTGLSDESRRRRFFTAAANVGRAAHQDAGERWPAAIGLVALAEGSSALSPMPSPYAPMETTLKWHLRSPTDYHGQGLATLLLIRLAVLAASHGIANFVAEVLPENHDMLAVFHAAFPDHASCRHGVVSGHFPTAAWPAARRRFERVQS